MRKLNTTEKKEPMMMTFGRIRALAQELKLPRLQALVEKFNNDLKYAKIDEKYFDKDFKIKVETNL